MSGHSIRDTIFSTFAGIPKGMCKWKRNGAENLFNIYTVSNTDLFVFIFPFNPAETIFFMWNVTAEDDLNSLSLSLAIFMTCFLKYFISDFFYSMHWPHDNVHTCHSCDCSTIVLNMANDSEAGLTGLSLKRQQVWFIFGFSFYSNNTACNQIS